MNRILENENWHVAVSDAGAELKSLVEKATGIDYLWSGDPAWWSGTAPILFPVVGGLKGGEFVYRDRRYEMPQHGFARRGHFSLKNRTSQQLQFELMASEETQAVYPFDFILSVSFSLDYAGLSVGYEVLNAGTDKMWFSLGSHPAFRLPFAGGVLENYYVHFSSEESGFRNFFENGLCLDETDRIFANSRQVNLSRGLFNRGPVILKGIRSDSVTIRNSLNRTRITLSTGGAPNLALWSKPNGAPFLCLEPWFGLPDSPSSTGLLEQKEGSLVLDAGKSFRAGYRIEVEH